MNKENVLQAVITAFDEVMLGEGIGLWQAQAIDDYETEEIQNKNRERDEKLDWRVISVHELQNCRSSLSFFDADGMRFHLPAYIVGSLKGEVDDPLFHLIYLDDYAKSKLVSFTKQQRQAITLYLNWCLDHEEYSFDYASIKRALSEYWQIESSD